MLTGTMQAIAGVTPPQVAEARIREIWPSVARMPLTANLGKMLTRSIIFAPLGWLVMAFAYFSKVLPLIGVRYTLTNRRVIIKRGWGGEPRQEVPLAEIEDVQLDPASVDNFFRCADLRIMRTGGTPMILTAVPDAESFRHAILDSRNAWAPGKVKTLPFIPASATK